MKTSLKIILAFMLMLSINSCTNSPQDKAKYAIQTYLKVNLKTQNSYEPLTFSEIDTLNPPDTMTDNQISYYKVKHEYTIVNEQKNTIKMSVDFYLNQDLKVLGTSTTSLTENE